MATEGKLPLASPPGTAEVASALRRILGSGAFANSPRLSSFLRFIVDHRLSGREESPKEYEIGVQVFGRGADYDPRVDPIVRVQARQLRFKLSEYYQAVGAAERIRIELPKGSYLPTIVTAEEVRESSPPAPVQPFEAAPPTERRYFARPAVVAALSGVLAAIVFYLIVAFRPVQIAGPSLAVLPFANLSADPANQYFSDGLTDELTDALTKIKPLRVIGRDSAFQFRGKHADIHEIASQLKVSNILQGSVERYGDRVKVVARLERSSDGSSIWSGTWERRAADLFAIQSELAAGITASLRVSVLDPPVKRHEPSPEAHDYRLRGRYELDLMTPESLHRAEEDLQHAIELDPAYAVAYLELGVAKHDRFVGRGTLSTADEIRDAERLYRKAIELDPRMGAAHANLAVLAMVYDWDWGRAEREIQAAVADGGSVGESTDALLLALHGRFAEADEHMRRALDQDPLGVTKLLRSADIRWWEGRFEQSREDCRKISTRAPEAFEPQIVADLTYVIEGRTDLALPLLRKLEVKYPQTRVFEAMVEARSGNRARALALLRPFEENYQTSRFPVQWFAWVYAFLGDDDNALQWLERSADRRESQALSFAVNPILRNLQHHPRFLALKARMGLDQ